METPLKVFVLLMSSIEYKALRSLYKMVLCLLATTSHDVIRAAILDTPFSLKVRKYRKLTKIQAKFIMEFKIKQIVQFCSKLLENLNKPLAVGGGSIPSIRKN